MLGLCCKGFSHVVESRGYSNWGVLAFHFHGFSCSWAQALGLVDLSSCGSQALEHRRSSCDAKCLVAPWHVGSSQIRTRDRTGVSCIGRWMLYHWATREAPEQLLYTNPLTRVCLMYPHGSIQVMHLGRNHRIDALIFSGHPIEDFHSPHSRGHIHSDHLIRACILNDPTTIHKVSFSRSHVVGSICWSKSTGINPSRTK